MNAPERRERVARVSEAVEWFTRLREQEVSEAELARWLEWCADAENLKEFQKVGELWHGLDQLKGSATKSLGAGVVPAGRTRGHFVRWGLAASLLVVCGGAALVSWHLFNHDARYRAQATIQSNDLPDGSQVTLAPRSAVATDFTKAKRVISMPQGEAFFKVHPDKSKPFVVKTEDVSVTAVGTAFDVNAGPQQVVVTVQEGTVEVTAPQGAPWRVTRGSQIIYDRHAKSGVIQRVEADRLVAWHTGRLEYVDRPLGQVVSDIGRYSAHVVDIGDTSLADIPYTGAVLTNAIDDWLAALQTTFPIRVITTQEGHHLLVSRSSPPRRAP